MGLKATFSPLRADVTHKGRCRAHPRGATNGSLPYEPQSSLQSGEGCAQQQRHGTRRGPDPGGRLQPPRRAGAGLAPLVSRTRFPPTQHGTTPTRARFPQLPAALNVLEENARQTRGRPGPLSHGTCGADSGHSGAGRRTGPRGAARRSREERRVGAVTSPRRGQRRAQQARGRGTAVAGGHGAAAARPAPPDEAFAGGGAARPARGVNTPSPRSAPPLTSPRTPPPRGLPFPAGSARNAPSKLRGQWPRGAFWEM